MNSQQAENLRILIRHADTMARDLNMDKLMDGDSRDSCGTPACMIGEALAVVRVPQLVEAHARAAEKLGAYDWADSFWRAVAEFYGCGDNISSTFRLFGTCGANAWRRATVTPQEWAVEARKVLAEHGYSMDDGFAAFKAKLLEPLQPEGLTVADVQAMQANIAASKNAA